MKNALMTLLTRRTLIGILVGVITLLSSQSLRAGDPQFEEVAPMIEKGDDITISWSGAPTTLYKIRIIKPNGQTQSANQYGTDQNGTGVPVTLEDVQDLGTWTFQLWPKDATSEDFLNGTPLDYAQTTVESMPE